MDINNCLKIAYGGSLDAYRVKPSRNRLISFLRKWLWTYKHDTIDASTRSAYFLIKAVRHLKDKHNLSPSQLQIHLWGSIDKLNSTHIEEYEVSEFFHVDGYLPKIESLERLSQSDLLFLPLEISNIENQRTLFIPGKLFEYLKIGKPILALCEKSDCQEILENSGLAIIVQPDNYLAIADTLFELIHEPSMFQSIKGNENFISSFSFKNKTQELAKVLNDLNVNSI